MTKTRKKIAESSWRLIHYYHIQRHISSNIQTFCLTLTLFDLLIQSFLTVINLLFVFFYYWIIYCDIYTFINNCFIEYQKIRNYIKELSYITFLRRTWPNSTVTRLQSQGLQARTSIGSQRFSEMILTSCPHQSCKKLDTRQSFD